MPARHKYKGEALETPRMKDLYEILRVHPSAEPEVIRAAFHRLAEKYHPDRNGGPGATERMCELNAAWMVLSDPESRA